jgi:hypothetical protein
MERVVTVLLAGAVIAVLPLAALALTRPPLAPLVAMPVVAAWLLPRRIWPDERRGAGLARIAVAFLLAVGTLIPAFLYVYAVSITAGLCGDGSDAVPTTAMVTAYAVVAGWGFRGRNRLLIAWPAAVLVGASTLLLASYVDPGAHGHCET